MDVLLGILCLIALLGIAAWAVDLVLLAPARAFRRWEQRQERIVRAAEEAARHAATGDPAADKEATRDEAMRAEQIIARATGRVPDAADEPTVRPTLRVIRGGPDSEPPEPAPEATENNQPAAESPPLPEGGPPFRGGRYRANLGPPDGPLLTVWQRNYIRYLFKRGQCAPEGLDMKQVTTGHAEKLVVMLGGNPRKLYTGGRAWGQKRR